MGMYDTVYFNCPSCGATLSEQSKAGACALESHWADDVPRAIAEAINHEHLWCECGKEWKVRAAVVKHIRCTLVEIGLKSEEEEELL